MKISIEMCGASAKWRTLSAWLKEKKISILIVMKADIEMKENMKYQ
jgi:hypothetical protein